MKYIFWLTVTLLAGCATPGGSQDPTFASSDVLVPRMPQPALDQIIAEDEWGDARVIGSEFVIEDGSNVSGRYPFTLLVGGDEERLSIAVTMPNLVPQQASEPFFLIPDHLVLYLSDKSGSLVRASDMLSMSHAADFGGDMVDGYWEGGAWRVQTETARGEFNDGRPTGGRWALAGVQNGSAIWEATIYRTSELAKIDGFQAAGPTEFRMLLRFCRPDWPDADPRTETRFDAHCDAYPGDGPTIGAESDPSNWLRFRFDY